MKILLTTLNSKYIHSNLALKYLYESSYGMNHDICLTEFTINNEENYIFSEILRGGYDAVCFSCYIWNITATLYLAANIKKADPKCIIVLGGPEVSFDADELMRKHQFIDYVMISEGEKTFCELISVLESGEQKLHDIKGLAFRRDNRVVVTSQRPLSDMNEIPFPYAHSIPETDRIVYYETSRGCPFSCTYCISSVVKGVRYLSVDRVKKELKFFLDRRVPQVKFVDRTFNSDKKRSIEIIKFIMEHDNRITNFHFEMSGDLIDENMLNVLKNSRKGLFQLEIGVQSVNSDVLAACRRKSDFYSFKEKVAQIMSWDNMHVHLDLIAGLPCETLEKFKNSFNDVYALNPHHLQLGFLKMLKGSRMRIEADDYGYVFREKEPYEVISSDSMTSGDLIRLKMIETVFNLYYNKSGFRTTLKYLMQHIGCSPFDFYDEFARYWHNNGLHHKYWSKEDLYGHMGRFAECMGIGQKEILGEVLAYDKFLASVRASGREGTDKKLNSFIHKMLQNEAFVEKNISCAAGMKAKEIIKKVNFGFFRYNINAYAMGDKAAIEKEHPNICIFNPEKKNLYQESEVIFIPVEKELIK